MAVSIETGESLASRVRRMNFEAGLASPFGLAACARETVAKQASKASGTIKMRRYIGQTSRDGTKGVTPGIISQWGAETTKWAETAADCTAEPRGQAHVFGQHDSAMENLLAEK